MLNLHQNNRQNHIHFDDVVSMKKKGKEHKEGWTGRGMDKERDRVIRLLVIEETKERRRVYLDSSVFLNGNISNCSKW